MPRKLARPITRQPLIDFDDKRLLTAHDYAIHREPPNF